MSIAIAFSFDVLVTTFLRAHAQIRSFYEQRKLI